MKKYILALSLFALFASCSEEKIPLYDTDTRYLYFADDNSKITRFSFKTSADVNRATIRIPLEMIGTAPAADVSFKVAVDAKLTTAKTANYLIPDAPLFRKGLLKDTLVITVLNSAELKTKELDIVLSVADNQNFLPGPTKFNLRTIRISDMIAQPDWWDADFTTIFLGEYSDEKYRHFIVATEVSDLTDKPLSEIQNLCREFIYYLRKLKDEGKEVKDEHGTPILETINFKA